MWPFSKSLEQSLVETKKVKVKGINFRIKKIDALSYLDGSKSLIKMYDVYQGKKKASDDFMTEGDLKKTREHFKDVLLAGVVSPKLSRKEDEDGVFVDKVFVDWDLVEKLYTEIMLFTYGKKKLSTFQGNG